MELLIARCAGLDVHQATGVATVRTPDDRGGRRRVTETFGTMTPDLLALREWLQAYRVTHVALESTGVYWKPVYYVLEDAFTLLLINMQDLKRVPGRKTDVRDSEWLAQLLECGLLKPSFVPPPAIRELRDLTRYRLQQARDRSQEVNRLCKVLEDAGLKLTTVITDVMGVSGRAMLRALVDGTTHPVVLADLARGRLRQKLAALRRALQGRFRPHHAFLIEQILTKIDFLDGRSRDGGNRSALGPIRTDAGGPGHDSGDRSHRRDQHRGGNRGRHEPVSLGRPLVQLGRHVSRPERECRQAAQWEDASGQPLLAWHLGPSRLGGHRSNGTALQARYRRVKRQRGHKKAVIAVGHHILEIAYYVMRDGRPYDELGADYFDKRHAERAARRHVRQLEALGFQVTIEKAA